MANLPPENEQQNQPSEPQPAANPPAEAGDASANATPADAAGEGGDAGERGDGKGRRRRRGGRRRRGEGRPDGEGGDTDAATEGDGDEGESAGGERREGRGRRERGERGERRERGPREDHDDERGRPRRPRNDDYSAAPRHAERLRKAINSDDYAALDGVAEKYGKEWGTKPPWVKNRFSTFQIRSIVGEMERLKRADFAGDTEAQQSFRLLKSQVSYLARRYHDDDLYEFCRIVRFAVDEVSTDAQKFKRFSDLFTALLAYFRANGGR